MRKEDREKTNKDVPNGDLMQAPGDNTGLPH